MWVFDKKLISGFLPSKQGKSISRLRNEIDRWLIDKAEVAKRVRGTKRENSRWVRGRVWKN